MADGSHRTIVTPQGLQVDLSADEYRLALLWLVDFEGNWDALEAATRFVADGDAKRVMLRERLRPLAGALDSLGEQVDALDVLVARRWFRSAEHAPPARGSI